MADADTTEVTESDVAIDSDLDENSDKAEVKGEDLEDRLVAEGEIAGDYLEELLDLLDFHRDIDLDVEGDRARGGKLGGPGRGGRPRSRERRWRRGSGQARRPQGRGARRASRTDSACSSSEDPAGQ